MTQGNDTALPCFIDTHIWLYAFTEQNSIKSAIAKSVIHENNVVLSTQVINEVCVNLIQLTTISETDLQELVIAFYKRYFVINMTQDIMTKSLKLREEYLLSFWDSLIIASALHTGVKRLYSEEMPDGLVVDNKIKIIDPFKH